MNEGVLSSFLAFFSHSSRESVEVFAETRCDAFNFLFEVVFAYFGHLTKFRESKQMEMEMETESKAFAQLCPKNLNMMKTRRPQRDKNEHEI